MTLRLALSSALSLSLSLSLSLFPIPFPLPTPSLSPPFSLLVFQWHRDHGIDTLLTGNGAAKHCGSSISGADIADKLAPKNNFYILAQTDISLKDVENTSNILAIFLSDESDTHVS